MFNNLFGPSVFLTLLDSFLECPEDLMNMREIARRTSNNPGNVSRVLPRLVDKHYVQSIRIGKKIIAYRLNQENVIVKLMLEFREKLKMASNERMS